MIIIKNAYYMYHPDNKLGGVPDEKDVQHTFDKFAEDGLSFIAQIIVGGKFFWLFEQR